MNDFLEKRLTEAAIAAEARADTERARAFKLTGKLAVEQERRAEQKRQLERAAAAVMRALLGAPPLVFPHIAPTPKSKTHLPEGGRFSLLELD